MAAGPSGPSIKYVTLFLANFDPRLPLSHVVTLTHPGTPSGGIADVTVPFSKPTQINSAIGL